MIYLSDRGIPLVYNEKPWGMPIITIENYLKWYSLFLVKPDGSVEKIENDGKIAWFDHVPCPADISRWADEKCYDLDMQAFEMIVGRFVMETYNIEPEMITHGLNIRTEVLR